MPAPAIPPSAPLARPPLVAAPRPFDVLALAGNGQASVQWRNVNTLADSYTVAASPGGAAVTVLASGMRGSATVTGLTNGTAYTFTVTANNSVGVSKSSAASNAVTPGALVTSLGFPTDSLEMLFLADQLGLADGATVPQLTDISGNGYHAIAEVAATYQAAWSNGKPAVSFPAAGARYSTATTGLVSGMRGPRQTIYLLYSIAAAPNASGVGGSRVLSAETPNTAINGDDFRVGFAIGTGRAVNSRVVALFDRTTAVLDSPAVEYASALTTLNAPLTVVARRPGSVKVNGTDLSAPLLAPFDLRQLASKNPALGNTPSTLEAAGFYIGAQIGDKYSAHAQMSLAAIAIYAATHTPAQEASVLAALASRS